MYSYKDIWKVSFPIILGLLAQNIIQITATIFMGRVGEIEFGAAGLAGIYYIAVFMLGFGFSVGGQIMISRRNGEKKYHEIGEIVIQGVLFLQLFALCLFLLSNFFTKNFLSTLLKSPEIYTAVEEYLSWRTFGFFLSFFNVMFRAFYVGIARTSVLTYNAIAMAIVNIIFDYALIFGNLGFPELGIAGAGIAAIIAEGTSIVFFIVYTYATVDFEKYGFRKMKFNFAIVRKILNISVFTMVQYAVSMSTWFIFFLAIENHGERDLAITNILRSFYMIYFIPMNALSTTANTLVGNTMGQGEFKSIPTLIKKICLLNFTIIIALVLLTISLPQFWISLIVSKNDLSLIQEAINPLLVLAGVLPICSISTVLFSSISGTGNTRSALTLEVATMFLYIFGIWYIIIHSKAPVAICWTVEYIYWGSLLIFSYLYLRFANWQSKKI